MPKNLHHTQLLNLLMSQDKSMDKLYRQTSVRLAAALKRFKLKKTTGLWVGNKGIEKEVDRIMALHGQGIKRLIESNIDDAWKLSNGASDDVTKDYLKGTGVAADGLLTENLGALAAFKARKAAGFKLSDRVWNLQGQTKAQLESLLASGVTEGRSAVKMAGDLKQYLKEPNRRYRRIKDPKTGKLILSNPSKNYHPGQGVYRSSYKNALRLSRNETNIAYRTADHLRVQQMPFVVGIKVQLSNAHKVYDICDELRGEYPKDFRFTGWHVNCLCFTTTVLLPKDKFIEYMKTGKLDPKYNIKGLPPTATKFIGANIDKIKKSKPYFYTDNPKYLDSKFPIPKTPVVKKPTAKKVVKEIVEPKVVQPIFTPSNISDYENKFGVKINKDIFSKLPHEIPLNINNRAQTHYDSYTKVVSIGHPKRWRDSKWGAESVVYHEYGHAEDWMHGYRNNPEVSGLMNRLRKKYRKENLYQQKHSKILEKAKEVMLLKNKDKLEQLGAYADTLMSLNPAYGFGHTKKYFRYTGKKEAEFIAHAFENKFIGNPIFEEIDKELFDEMKELVDKLRSGIKQ